MKIKLTFLSALLVAATSVAAPLPQDTSIHVRPSSSSPTIGKLGAGTEPVAVTTGYGVLPSGWIAVTVKGPHEVFVQQKDLTKSLDAKPGAPLHREPRPESDVLTVAAEGDQAEIIGLRGRWTQLSLKRDILGYIQVASASTPSQAVPLPPPATRAPTSAAVTPAPATGQAVPIVQNPGEQSLPRLFQGRLTSTRNPLRPRRPYDFQLTGEGGERYAYADLSKLLLTEQLDKYLDRTVVVYGAAQPVPGTQDIVIVVESLQLR